MISIIDYGAGNVGSVVRMVERVGGAAERVTVPSALAGASKIILPGVGAFDNGMKLLSENGWIAALSEAVLGRHVPILGVCLGMQLLCKSSEEGKLPGLGWIDASVHRLSADGGLKIPHMGWNVISARKDSPLFSVTTEEQRFYFVHSYHVVCHDPADILATVSYGIEVVAALSRDNIYGVQFHPEKSHRFGMALMKRFVELEC